jgi:formylglycine-generating enzyme required for sulfatase activity
VAVIGNPFDPDAYDPQAIDVGTTPERPAVVSRFWMDRNEVSVAQWRAAIAAGLVPTDDITPEENPGAIVAQPDTSPHQCSYSATPVGREDFAISCVGWYSARDYCRFQGGDLPTEAQWEYATTSAARPVKTRYAWGGDDEVAPSCDQAVWGRGASTVVDEDFACVDANHPFGPQPVSVFASADVTPVLGIVGLGGNEREWELDSAQSFDSPCWHGATLHDPKCYEDDAPLRIMRGDAWNSISFQLIAALRLDIFPSAEGSTLGFRCAYATPPPGFVGAQ